MADAGYNFREVRVVYEDDLTHCYVYLEPVGDCPVGVQGWHYKAFPLGVPGDKVFHLAARALEWPLAAPRSWGQHETPTG